MNRRQFLKKLAVLPAVVLFLKDCNDGFLTEEAEVNIEFGEGDLFRVGNDLAVSYTIGFEETQRLLREAITEASMPPVDDAMWFADEIRRRQRNQRQYNTYIL